MDSVERAIEMLNELLKRKMHSPAAYILEASPYATEADSEILREVGALQELANRHANEAARRVMALEGVPNAGSYESQIADSNYLSVRFLLRRLVDRLDEDLKLFEKYRDECEVSEAKDLFAQVVKDDQGPRHRLREMLEAVEEERRSAGTHFHGND